MFPGRLLANLKGNHDLNGHVHHEVVELNDRGFWPGTDGQQGLREPHFQAQIVEPIYACGCHPPEVPRIQLDISQFAVTSGVEIFLSPNEH